MSTDTFALRVWPDPELPERPYPVLLPYTHPDLLAGRDRELSELRAVLERKVPITGVYAVSGTGKSSFLYAGLVRGLRREGRPIAFDRHACELGLASRLLCDLLQDPAQAAAVGKDDDPQAFVTALETIRELAGTPPILVIDQFEDVLRRPGAARARLRLGWLLAATAGRENPPCRWILAYRQEFHGDVMLWLNDVSQRGEMGLETDMPLFRELFPRELPRDFSRPERFQFFRLTPLGTPEYGTEMTAEAASEVFREAVAKPLAAARYPWRFSGEGLRRLTFAFGEARARRWEAPLVPELQVVLAHLLERAGDFLPEEVEAGKIIEVEVPEDVQGLIDQALEDHLRRGLDIAIPLGLAPDSGKRFRALRTRTLLALRELADAEGRCGDALPGELLARAIGEEGAEVLEMMATESTRLVVPVRRKGELAYVLSHDQLAEVLVRLVDEGRFQGLGVDRELLDLRRFVSLQCGLFTAGETDSGAEMPAKDFARIEAHRDALLWGKERERWWEASRARRRRELRRARARTTAAGFLLLLISLATWYTVDRQARLDALFEEVAKGDPQLAFLAAHTLLIKWKRDPEEIRERLRTREAPMILLDRGAGEVEGESRDAAVLRIAEMALPLITEDAPEDPVRIGSFIWALDFFALQKKQTQEMRNLALLALREKHPPPPLPEIGDPLWAEVPAGTFWMGAGPGEGRDDPDMAEEHPRHQVTISAFRMGIYEVTNAEFRRLFPEHAKGEEDRLPAVNMTWNEAYTYAAWLGGRLPTEAEAEYVRRGGCDFTYCDRNGEETTLDAVAWWVGNSANPDRSSPVRPVGLLEPNPWGFYDLYGNVLELCADWYDKAYAAEPQIDPPGAAACEIDYRIARGGSAWDLRKWVVPSAEVLWSREQAQGLSDYVSCCGTPEQRGGERNAKPPASVLAAGDDPVPARGPHCVDLVSEAGTTNHASTAAGKRPRYPQGSAPSVDG